MSDTGREARANGVTWAFHSSGRAKTRRTGQTILASSEVGSSRQRPNGTANEFQASFNSDAGNAKAASDCSSHHRLVSFLGAPHLLGSAVPAPLLLVELAC